MKGLGGVPFDPKYPDSFLKIRGSVGQLAFGMAHGKVAYIVVQRLGDRAPGGFGPCS